MELLLYVLALCAASPAAWSAGPEPKLRFAAVVTRHGVRSPTAEPAQLNQYSTEAWPQWPVEPGNLTPHGRQLMQLFGAYYRQYFQQRGLLPQSGCDHTRSVYWWADTDQRTRETAKALAQGLLPGCTAVIHTVSEGEDDPLFNPIASGMVKPDAGQALAAVLGKTGGKPAELAALYRPELEELERILTGCIAGKTCGGGSLRPKTALASLPVAIAPGKRDNPVEIGGSLRTASTLTENLLLEYAEGMQGKDLGWGRLSEQNLRQVMRLHTAYADLARRTPYLARARGGNLLNRVLLSLQQAATGKSVSGALGSPGDSLLVISGHDTNISNLSGMLGLSWLLPGYQPDDAVPGGALVFELWSTGNADLRVRTYYIAQTLSQMRAAQPLTLDSPPAKAPLFIPECGSSAPGYDCTWAGFARACRRALGP